jgi:hypothetical protein
LPVEEPVQFFAAQLELTTVAEDDSCRGPSAREKRGPQDDKFVWGLRVES